MVQWLRLRLPMQGVWIQSLLWGELRSHMFVAKKPKHKNRNNIVTNSIKTLKIVHIKKKLKKGVQPFLKIIK